MMFLFAKRGLEDSHVVLTPLIEVDIFNFEILRFAVLIGVFSVIKTTNSNLIFDRWTDVMS